MTRLQIRKMTLNPPAPADAAWLGRTLDRVSAPYGCHVDPAANGDLTLRWENPSGEKTMVDRTRGTALSRPTA
jgi:hypothetical protein